MNNRLYWIERAQHRELAANERGTLATAALLRDYKKAATAIRKDINDFYQRFADDYGLTYEQAVREMSRADLQEWQDSVEGYLNEIRQCGDPVVRERLMREYDARYLNSRINRLEGLTGNINMEIGRLYMRAEEQFRELLGDTYHNGYYRTMFDIQTRLGYNGAFSALDAQIVENALTYPWSGANFSDRLWKNKTALIDAIRETLTQGLIRGDSIKDMSNAVADKLNSSYSNAERLVRTETSHIHNTAELEAYEAAGYEQYEFMASLGERTCDTCGELDGKRFKIADKQYGVNFPPVHPNCRCTTIGYDPEDELDELETEQEQLEYDEWYERYVEGREQTTIAEHQTAPALLSENQPTVPINPLTNAGDGGTIKAKRNGATRAAMYSQNWQTVSLSEKIKYYGLDIVSAVDTKGKITYSSENTTIKIVYDVNGNYFRIMDTAVYGRGAYLDADGKSALNKTVNGKIVGRSRDEFQRVTHFNNADKEVK